MSETREPGAEQVRPTLMGILVLFPLARLGVLTGWRWPWTLRAAIDERFPAWVPAEKKLTQ